MGATKVYPGHKVTDPQPESAVLDPAYPPYSSGGGFSNIYPIPDYQTKAVANYFANYSPPYPYYSALSPDSSEVPNITAIVGNSNGIYNRIGRGIPDVSANGDNDAVSYFLYFLFVNDREMCADKDDRSGLEAAHSPMVVPPPAPRSSHLSSPDLMKHDLAQARSRLDS